MTEIELYEKQHKRYSIRVYPIFLKALQVQLQPTIDYIRTMQDTNPPLDLLVKPGVFKEPMNEAYEIVGMLAAKRQYYWMRSEETKGAIDFLLDVWRAIFYDYSTKYAYQIDNELAETTKEEIRKALAYSYEQGWNADRTATYIRNSVGRQISRSRAALIARTETATAANLGKLTGARSWLDESNQKGYKQWIGRTVNERSTHLELNDTIVPLDTDFIVGGEKANIPGDTRLSANERCNCRCTVIYMSERRYNALQAAKKFDLVDLVV